jgi:hypothetical protein
MFKFMNLVLEMLLLSRIKLELLIFRNICLDFILLLVAALVLQNCLKTAPHYSLKSTENSNFRHVQGIDFGKSVGREKSEFISLQPEKIDAVDEVILEIKQKINNRKFFQKGKMSRFAIKLRKER